MNLLFIQPAFLNLDDTFIFCKPKLFSRVYFEQICINYLDSHNTLVPVRKSNLGEKNGKVHNFLNSPYIQDIICSDLVLAESSVYRNPVAKI
jgi:hypothetical protein